MSPEAAPSPQSPGRLHKIQNSTANCKFGVRLEFVVGKKNLFSSFAIFTGEKMWRLAYGLECYEHKEEEGDGWEIESGQVFSQHLGMNTS